MDVMWVVGAYCRMWLAPDCCLAEVVSGEESRRGRR